MAEVQWYYARDDQPMGPVSIADLQRLAEVGQLKPDDLLWREGMDAWTTAINLRGLFEGDPAAPAEALTPMLRQPRPVQRAAPARPAASSQRTQLRSWVRATQIILWTTCVLVVTVGVVLFTRALLDARDAAAETAAGAVFATFFVAAYVLAQCGERLSRLLLSHIRRRKN